jgi:ATP-dependent DNA helicase PIF1
LQGTAEIFEARDGGAIVDKAQRDKLLQNCMAPEIITLKKGAQVMLIKNIDESLVNGSIGRVIGFMSEARFDEYHANEENSIMSPDGTTFASSSDDHLTEQQKATVHTFNGSGITTTRKYPVVRFMITDGTSRDLLCQPETWKVELPNGEVQASRSQIPLILAWALSIHKAQGQTLERVKVDLGKVFEKGQAYVALSRATSIQGLQVLRFDPKKVVAHEKVAKFYANLSRVELAEKNKTRLSGLGMDGDKDKGKKKVDGKEAGEYEKMFVEDDLDF